MPRGEFHPIHEHILVQNIIDPDEREARRRAFRVERMRQRELLATIGGLLIEEAMDGATPEALLATLDEYKESAAMADYQEQIFRRIIREFASRKDYMRKLTKDVAPEETFERLFEMKPQGPFRVEQRTLTLHALLNGADYNLIAGENDPESARSGGRYFPGRHKTIWLNLKRKSIPAHRGTLSIGRMHGPQFAGAMESTARHEETHAMYDVMRFGLGKGELSDTLEPAKLSDNEVGKVAGQMHQTKRDEVREHLLREFWRAHIAQNTEPLKNELFAYARGGGRKPEQIRAHLTQKKEQKGLYDYFARDRKDVRYILGKEFLALDKTTADARMRLVDQVTDDFFTREYRDLVSGGIDILGQLLRESFTIEQAMVFLVDTPLAGWKEEMDERAEMKQNGDL